MPAIRLSTPRPRIAANRRATPVPAANTPNRSRWTIAFASGALFSIVLAGDIRSTRAEDEHPPAPTAAALVAALGDESYAVRRSAEMKLLGLGESIRGELAHIAQTEGDLEIRLRSRQVLEALDALRARAYRRSLAARLDAFVDDDNAERADHDFPGWKSYRVAVGGDRAARELFAQMQRDEPDLLAHYERNAEDLSRALSARSLEIMQSMSHPLPHFRTSIAAGRAAALYFAATRDGVTLDAKSASQLYSMANQPAVREMLAESDAGKPLRKVVGNWVASDQSGERNLGYYKVLVAMQHNMPEGRQAGLNLIKDDKAGVASYQFLQGLLAIARFGEKGDIDAVEPLLENRTVCQTSTMSVNGNRTTYTTEVRDVALVVLIQLTGQDHRQYGFDRLQKNSRSLFSTNTMGFEKDDEKGRKAALDKWRRWKAGQKNEDPNAKR